MDPLTLAFLSGGANLLGSALFKPKRSEFDPMEIYAWLQQASRQRAASRTTEARDRLGPSLAGRGLGGGAVAGIMGKAEGAIQGEEQAGLDQAMASLLAQKQMLDTGYNQQVQDWWGGMFGDVAQVGGGIAGYLQEKKSLETLGGMVDEYFKSQGLGQPGGQKGQLVRGGIQAPNTTSKIGGMHAGSFQSQKSPDQFMWSGDTLPEWMKHLPRRSNSWYSPQQRY